jgi:hypothetical protein
VQSFIVVVGAEDVGSGSPGAIVPAGAPLELTEPVVPGEATPPPTDCSAQVHVAGHSASAVHAMIFGWHDPGKLAVMQDGSGAVFALPPSIGMLGALAAAELFEAVAGVGAPPLPLSAQAPAEGWQTKPSPQSASALQASCHLYAHSEIVFGTHGVEGVVGHFAPAAHATPLLAQSSVDE